MWKKITREEKRMKMNFEPTQKGNPYKITKKQHFHTAYCISKFEREGRVDVIILSSDKPKRLKKTDSIFCAKRSWDERAEHGYMKSIEDAFHNEVDTAKIGALRNHKAISEYHLLWRLRRQIHKNPMPDARLIGVSGSNLTKMMSSL